MNGLNGANVVRHVVLMRSGREQELVVSIVEKTIFKNALIILTWYNQENSNQSVCVVVVVVTVVVFVSVVIVEKAVTIMEME